ncbi:histidine kinase [Clostridium sp. CAG:921]|nr:histidine kinase [Clostridium sp. CAG:921]
MVDGVRTLKHDYNNIMQALNGYVSTKQYDKLQEHINSVLKECNVVNNLSVIDPKLFNEPAIYGIVGSKFFLATEADITFDFDVTSDIATIPFPMPELSRILGILLDNAIEATKKATKQYIRLEIKFDNRKNADIIKVINTYDANITININDIYKKGYSTKEVKSGIGLWEVKKLIKKNPNSQIFAYVNEDEHQFIQNIIIER